ncbi:mCG1041491 [Mus musculus]|nr:mCG1041491 [Mus musculus]
MTISPHSAGLASPCLAPCSHPAPIRFSGCLLHCSWGSQSSSQSHFCCCLPRSPLLSFLLFIPSLCPPHTHIPLQIVLFTPGVGHGLKVALLCV